MAPSGRMAASAPKIMLPIPGKAAGGNRVPYLSSRPAYLNVRNWCSSFQDPQHLSLHAATVHSKSLSSIASPLLRGEHYSYLPGQAMPFLPPNQGHASPRNHTVPKASKNSPLRPNNYPPMTEKPRWWWRTLSCIPYLIPLHKTWTCAESAFYLSSFLEELEFFVDSFNWYVESFPVWFWMAYSMALYLGVVRRRQWPHFLRFHIVNSVLLENILEIVIIVCGWMPRAIFHGRAGLHFWTAIAVAYLFTVLECMRCALGGMYADVPFVCDAAYMQCD